MTHLTQTLKPDRFVAPLDGRVVAHSLADTMICERVTFGDGLAVCRASGTCQRDTTFAAPDDAADRLHLQVITRGRCVFTEQSRELPLYRRRTTVIHSTGRAAAWTITSSQPVSVLSIDISERRLNDWLCGEEGPQAVRPTDWRDRLARAEPPGDDSFHAVAGLIGLFERTSASRLTLEARVLNAIVLSLRPSDAGDDIAQDGREAVDRLALVREMVEQLAPEASSVCALAEMAGMSPRRLAQAYRRAYGVTLFQALLSRRLERAYDELRTGRRPVKQIAWRAGYDHPTSFTHAFQRRFGVPPRAVRPN